MGGWICGGGRRGVSRPGLFFLVGAVLRQENPPPLVQQLVLEHGIVVKIQHNAARAEVDLVPSAVGLDARL
jgi:hypothetical protein